MGLELAITFATQQKCGAKVIRLLYRVKIPILLPVNNVRIHLVLFQSVDCV